MNPFLPEDPFRKKPIRVSGYFVFAELDGKKLVCEDLTFTEANLAAERLIAAGWEVKVQ
jgi:hypothetical protein